MTPYIPPRDGDLMLWADNFRDLIVAAPATYGLAAPDGVVIAGVVDDFDAALTLATSDATKTKSTVAAKNGAKAAMLTIIRPYAQQIRNNLGVSTENKTALGLTIVDTSRTPIPTPSSSPLLSVIGATQGVHTLRFADANTPDKRSKPFGALGLQVFVAVGANPEDDVNAASFKTFITRQPAGIEYEHADNGKIATYFARWQTNTGKVGPWSNPVSFTIAS